MKAQVIHASSGCAMHVVLCLELSPYDLLLVMCNRFSVFKSMYKIFCQPLQIGQVIIHKKLHKFKHTWSLIVVLFYMHTSNRYILGTD